MKRFYALIAAVVCVLIAVPQSYADAQTDAAAELAIASALAAHHHGPANDAKLFSQAEVDMMIDNAVFKDRLDRELEAQKSASAAQYVDVRVCNGNSCHIERRLKSAECPNGLCPNGQCANGQCVSGCDCTSQSYGIPVMQYRSMGGGCANGMCGSSSGGCSSGNCGSGGGRGRRGR